MTTKKGTDLEDRDRIGEHSHSQFLEVTKLRRKQVTTGEKCLRTADTLSPSNKSKYFRQDDHSNEGVIVIKMEKAGK